MILYIAARSDFDVGSVTHLKALQDIYGKENVFRIDLRLIKPFRQENYIAYGKYKSKSDRIIRWIQGNTMFISNSQISEICSLIKDKKITMVFSEESILGNLMRNIKKQNPNIKIICFYHDIAADLYRQRRKRGGIEDKIECTITIRQERINRSLCDINLVFHDSDIERFEKYYGVKPDYKVPLSSPIPDTNIEEMKSKSSAAGEKKKLLFVGSSYYPNIEGIKWFYSNVLPQLNGDFELSIVGRGTEILKKDFTDPRVHVVGFVDSLKPYYREADVFIAPIFDGGGMKVKSIEAVSYAKTFVGTAESLHGFWEEMDSVQNKVVFRCNTAVEWIETLNSLISSETKKFNPDLFEIFKAKFSYEAMLSSFREIFEAENIC